ncbi:MAG: hypothetical protein JNJ75_12405 [Cyclobacteriaceae bacterium]|nr:hypothetical protein [Cyclobacteriaceae bacterium]
MGNGQKDMRVLAIILFFNFWTDLTHGQGITLNVVTFNPCNSTYENELLVHLVKDGKMFQISDTLGTIYLPDPGIYKLKVFDYTLYRLVDSVKVITISQGKNYDTLTRSAIMDCYVINCVLPPQSAGDCGYSCCDQLCEGYNVDYFDNGNKRLEGYFKKGNPVGQLIFYHPDGRKKEIHHYDKAGNGRLKRKETVGK